ncbi:SDR family NAD(P)-dependent oxidoreductase [Natrarchaeobius chitinivorans]|uniref:SDR family oxidoreductase n=1 Tax=Natrarchaeobius chitinivorans TaxID=1679083 RepID=A0A3N6N8R6_NATCH|nr:SDR family oxidoreductase [Natrarchaeobius chitinivorans]RQG94872.1 SDR family oxidoreductase [Natrarchaeobius chitinivorans]
MSSLLPGRTAVVTGASSGIGRAIALRFAANGADVVIADVREEPRSGGTPTHEKIVEETGAEAAFVECDVTSFDDVQTAVTRAEEFGGIDIMVNNAGIGLFGDFLDVTEEEFDQMMAINQKGVFFGCQAAIPPMLEQGHGRIINMSSLAGVRGWAQSSTYCMSKGAVKLLTYTLATEFGADGIRTNAIHPGTIETEMTQTDLDHDSGEDEETLERIALNEVGAPEDVANSALFLASDLGSYINGHSLMVDGGMANIQT